MAMHGVPQGVTTPPEHLPEEVEEVTGERAHEIAERLPGTLILAFVFLAAFVLYYFANWKLLSLVWKIG